MKKYFIFTTLLLFVFTAKAQSVDEIIDQYLEVTGGKDNWRALKSIRISGKANQMGMEFPYITLQTASGKQKNTFTFQGQEMVQPAFDGNEGWSTNFMTMKAEKMETEDSENMKREIGDFPSPLLDYKEKGYSAVLEGKETIEGTECFKVKFTKKPLLVDGKEEENISYYFFDTESYALIVVKSTQLKGQGKGTVVEVIMSDYQEVEGLYFPFSTAYKQGGQGGVSLGIDKIELNIEVDDKEFVFPN